MRQIFEDADLLFGLLGGIELLFTCCLWFWVNYVYKSPNRQKLKITHHNDPLQSTISERGFKNPINRPITLAISAFSGILAAIISNNIPIIQHSNRKLTIIAGIIIFFVISTYIMVIFIQFIFDCFLVKIITYEIEYKGFLRKEVNAITYRNLIETIFSSIFWIPAHSLIFVMIHYHTLQFIQYQQHRTENLLYTLYDTLILSIIFSIPISTILWSINKYTNIFENKIINTANKIEQLQGHKVLIITSCLYLFFFTIYTITST